MREIFSATNKHLIIIIVLLHCLLWARLSNIFFCLLPVISLCDIFRLITFPLSAHREITLDDRTAAKKIDSHEHLRRFKENLQIGLMQCDHRQQLRKRRRRKKSPTSSLPTWKFNLNKIKINRFLRESETRATERKKTRQNFTKNSAEPTTTDADAI